MIMMKIIPQECGLQKRSRGAGGGKSVLSNQQRARYLEVWLLPLIVLLEIYCFTRFTDLHLHDLSGYSNYIVFGAWKLMLTMELPSQPVYVTIPPSNEPIESARLLLRPVCDSDAAALFAIRARPEVAKTK